MKDEITITPGKYFDFALACSFNSLYSDFATILTRNTNRTDLELKDFRIRRHGCDIDGVLTFDIQFYKDPYIKNLESTILGDFKSILSLLNSISEHRDMAIPFIEGLLSSRKEVNNYFRRCISIDRMAEKIVVEFAKEFGFERLKRYNKELTLLIESLEL